MRKTPQKHLVLNSETVRSLQEQELAKAAGGYNSNVICPQTAYYTCRPQTRAARSDLI